MSKTPNIGRKQKKLTRRENFAEVQARLDDHALAITMSAQAHKNASDFLLKFLDKLDLKVNKTEDGNIEIVSKSGIVTLDEVKKGL
jgi:hypothetical protein